MTDDDDPAMQFTANQEAAAKFRQRLFQQAHEAFASGSPPSGTLVETYITLSRGIPWDAAVADIRFHPAIFHSKEFGRWPAMVAAMRPAPSAEITAIHVTFLAPDGLAKAPVKPSRKVYGQAKASAIWLFGAAPEMAIAESIEKALAISAAAGLKSVSGYSAGNLANVDPPPQVSKWLIAADRGDAAEAAACKGARRISTEQ